MRLLGKYAVLLIAFALLGRGEVRVYGSEPQSEISVSQQHDEQENTNLDAGLHKISILYENNKEYPRWSYADNIRAHRALVDMAKALSSGTSGLRSIIIEGMASPLGSEEYNNRLALRRAEALRDIIAGMEGGDKLRIHVISAGEDWTTFKSSIEKNYHKPNRGEVLAILASDATNDHKELQLQQLDGGKTWQILVRDFMASARNVAMIKVVETDDLVPKSPSWALCPTITPIGELHIEREEPVAPQPQQQPYEPTPQQKQASALRKPVVAVRTNLLVPALNVGVEVPIGTHWSVGADYYFPWIWPKRDNKNCFELLSWGIEGRYWFGRNRTVFDRLQGHSIGVYGYMGYYDFERNYHGHQGEFVNVGLDYTYAMAVGKRKQIHFEFSLGVGYIYSQARKYSVIDAGGPLISDKTTKKIGFFGPTKANVSLVVPIFQKVKPNDKHRGDE